MPLPTNPFHKKLGQHIHLVVEQVSSRLKYFLETITNIYETYGINFTVKHNYTNLMRMLTPFELLCRFQIIDNNQIFSEQLLSKVIENVDKSLDGSQKGMQLTCKLSGNSHDYLEKDYRKQKKGGKNNLDQDKFACLYNNYQSMNIPSISLLKTYKESQENLYMQKKSNQEDANNEDGVQQITRRTIPKSNSSTFRNENKAKQEKSPHNPPPLTSNLKQEFSLIEKIKRDKSTNYRQKGIIGKKKQNLSVIKSNTNHFMRDSIYFDANKGYLTDQLEKELYQWSLGQLNKNRTLYIRDIILQAKYLGRFIPNLSTSYGWVQRFFSKYPKLKNLFRKSKGFSGNLKQSLQLDINEDSKIEIKPKKDKKRQESQSQSEQEWQQQQQQQSDSINSDLMYQPQKVQQVISIQGQEQIPVILDQEENKFYAHEDLSNKIKGSKEGAKRFKSYRKKQESNVQI